MSSFDFPGVSDSARERLAVIATNTDATLSKICAVQTGYWDDPFLPYFLDVDPSALEPSKDFLSRPPLINRGTYARVAGIDSAIRRFLAAGGRQIVLLGAGFDTTYARLRIETPAVLPPDVKWVETDFPEVVSSKLSVISRHKDFESALSGSSTWFCLPVDLTDLQAVSDALLRTAALDPAQPTLFVAEVVLVYIAADPCDALLRWISSTFAAPLLAVFEQARANDPFGRQMLANLARRGCSLPGLVAYPGLKDQQKRYEAAGFDVCRVLDMNAEWAQLLEHSDAARKRHIQSLEILDEVEEWQLLQAHYSVVFAAKHETTKALPELDLGKMFIPQLPYTARADSAFPAWNRHQNARLPQNACLGARFCK